MKKFIFLTLLMFSFLFLNRPVIANANVNMGDFKITYYWPGEDQWGYQTATGVRSSHLYTCAVDPNVIPLGSKLLIDGEEYIAVDVGGAVKGDVVDIFTEYPIHECYHAHVEIITTK